MAHGVNPLCRGRLFAEWSKSPIRIAIPRCWIYGASPYSFDFCPPLFPVFVHEMYPSFRGCWMVGGSAHRMASFRPSDLFRRRHLIRYERYL